MSETLPPVPVTSALNLKERLDRGEAVALLDVREPVERDYCRIGAGELDLHVALGRVPHEVETIRAAVNNRTLVVYCHHGMRSMVAARWLAGQGFAAVENLDGGIDAWSREVDAEVPRYVI